jgi:hypothetical protein
LNRKRRTRNDQQIPTKFKKRKTLKKSVGFTWGKSQEDAFTKIKMAIIITNACWGGIPDLQYHLVTDSSNYAYGGCLFQLIDVPPGTVFKKELIPKMRIVQFVSKGLTNQEQKYHATEREALAVIRCFEEFRWLILGASENPVIVYTDHESLLSAL